MANAAAGRVSHASLVMEPTDEPMIWVAGSQDDTFEEQVLRSVAQDPRALDDTQAVVQSLLESAREGIDVDLSEIPSGPSGDVQELQQTLHALIAVEGLSPKARRTTLGDVEEITATPSNYPVRGEALNDKRSWRFYTIIAARACYAGVCDDTDRITIRWTMDPGRRGDRFGFNSRYFPNSGAFEDIYALGGVYANGFELATEYIGAEGAQDGNGSGEHLIEHGSTAGDHTEQLIRMQAYFKPGRYVEYDRAKTGRAYCRTGAENRECVYG